MAELLLERGGSVDVRDTRKQTALHKTIDRHDKDAIDAVRFLLQHGADVNAPRDDLWTPLHLAVNIGALTVTRVLLEHQADVNLKNDDGQSPLHLLSRRESSQEKDDDASEIAKLLLERGANVDEKDKDNATPLHFSSYNKRPKVVRVLLDHGANANAKNDQGETPLQIVLKCDYNMHEDGIIIALLLLERCVEAYARDQYHIAASDLACCFGREKIRRVLLGDEEILKPENKRDKTIDQTAFWLLIEGEYFFQEFSLGVSHIFVECGVDGNVQEKYDTILLHSASYHGRPEMARILLNHGVKSIAKNHKGETALHMVSRGIYGSQDGVLITHLLLESGADVNAQDNDNDTPLHSSSYSGKLEIARFLLDHDAKADSKNVRGETPLHQVSQGEYESQADGVRIAQLLLDRGVGANAQDKKGVTALHLASWSGKLEIVRLLIEHATLNNDRVYSQLLVGTEGEYSLKENNLSITHTSSRAHRGVEHATKGRRNPTALCMLPGEGRDRTAASRPRCGCKC